MSDLRHQYPKIRAVKYAWSIKIGSNSDVSYLEEELMMTAQEVLTKPDTAQEVFDTAQEVLTESDKQVLLKFLEIEWHDHFQTRTQTWKALEIEAPMVLGLVAIQWQLDNYIATILASLALIVIAFFGASITLHHREVEIKKLSAIRKIEDLLGAKEMGVFSEEKPPYHIIWYKVFFQKPSTPSFILITHYMIIVFAIIFLTYSLVHLL